MFNPDAKGFSATNMAYLAHCAQAVYKTDSECKTILADMDSEFEIAKLEIPKEKREEENNSLFSNLKGKLSELLN